MNDKLSRRLFLGSTLTIPAMAALSRAVDPDVAKAEADRIAVINKVRPAVVCVCSYGGGVVGSGVLISPDGYVLTNYHVSESISPVMQGGLADGNLYDGVIVGQDKIGDVALLKLMPRKDGTPYPYAVLGDSDACRSGDWSLAMGNPFGLAVDFTPTVTYGLISGVNRYQPPEGGGTLEYTDCIQIETSINPGNSGGPLFNMKGELIGINGRGSFDKRGRVNSGVGYAISINQIKNFLGLFKAGLDTDHATLGATVQTKNEDGALSLMTIGQVLEESDAFRRGLKPDDELVSFAGRPLTSTNQFKNILGIFPKDWRLPLVYRRDNVRKEILVRLMHNMDVAVNPDAAAPDKKQPPKPKGPPDPNAAKAKKSPAQKLFVEKKGYANWYFNEIEQKKLWAEFVKLGDFSTLTSTWNITGSFDCNERKGDFTLSIGDVMNEPEAKLKLNVEYAFKPLKTDNLIGERLVPDGSGGLLSCLYQWRRLLIEGAKGFESNFSHYGMQPAYIPGPDGVYPADLSKCKVMCDVLKTRHAAVECKWYFDQKDHKLVLCETFTIENDDPCEVYFGDYKAVEGRQLPGRLDVRLGDKRYGYLVMKDFKLK
ncbi:trypsin-like peptidase domain-containing protein [soil metagenome]